MEELIFKIEIDHTPLDVMTKDDSDLPDPGRAVQLTTIHDHSTGCILDFSLSLSSPITGHGNIKPEDN